jgi:hypothetical protein
MPDEGSGMRDDKAQLVRAAGPCVRVTGRRCLEYTGARGVLREEPSERVRGKA